MDNLFNLSPQALNSLFGFIDKLSSVVFWLRSSDYKRQVYVSKAYECIWQRSCNSLYSAPYKWGEALVQQNQFEKVFKVRQANDYVGTVAFKIWRPDDTFAYIKDESCPLVDSSGKKVAVMGIGERITAEDFNNLEGSYKSKEKSYLVTNFLEILKQECALGIESRANNISKRNHIYIGSKKIDLSKREFDCLKSLMKGDSAKHTARELGISYRTVESYLNNLRYKARAESKIELLNMVRRENPFIELS